MSRSAPATAAEIRLNFDKALDAAIRLGQWPPSDQGFDDKTNNALRAVAEAYPDATQGLIEGAREELRAQLDGTHRRQKSADIERWFNEQG